MLYIKYICNMLYIKYIWNRFPLNICSRKFSNCLEDCLILGPFLSPENITPRDDHCFWQWASKNQEICSKVLSWALSVAIFICGIFLLIAQCGNAARSGLNLNKYVEQFQERRGSALRWRWFGSFFFSPPGSFLIPPT